MPALTYARHWKPNAAGLLVPDGIGVLSGTLVIQHLLAYMKFAWAHPELVRIPVWETQDGPLPYYFDEQTA
jgi:hypothetical protein